jgi:hypothetical protein
VSFPTADNEEQPALPAAGIEADQSAARGLDWIVL